MVRVDELRLLIEKRGYTIKEIAYLLGVSNRTLESRLDKGNLGSEDIEKMRIILKIKNPGEIFFAKNVT